MTLRRFLLALASLALFLSLWGYLNAVSDPVVRRADLRLPGWPRGAAPVRVVLMSDLHVIDPDMPPRRLARIVAQVNALRPDLVLIAGDFVSDRQVATRIYPTDAAIAPLAALKPRLGTLAVLGNHDHYRDAGASRRALRKYGIRVLDNQAVEVGPLAVGGLDDPFTDHDDPASAVAAMRRLKGARVLLSHSPDPFAKLPPDIGLMVAGHTHCGQISLPILGPVESYSDYGNRFACGLIREHGSTLIVSAGLGTSILPLRIGTRPDLWLLTLSGR